VEIGNSGMKDHGEIIPLLHRLKRPTLPVREEHPSRPALSKRKVIAQNLLP
jgi:hypothetical protein